MAKDILPIAPLTTEGSGFDLASAAIRKAAGSPDSMSGKVQFKAVVLKPLGGRQTPQVKSATEGTPTPISKQDRRGNYFGYRVRIIEENSPHALLPDPCQPQTKGARNKTLMDMHTLAWSREKLNYGDEVIIRLDRRDYSYNLEQAYVVEIGMSNAQRYKLGKQCSQAVDQSTQSLQHTIENLGAGGSAPYYPQFSDPGATGHNVGGPSTVIDINKAYPKAAAQPGLAEKIVEVANNLGIADPGWLANLINMESGFNASLQNAQGSDCWGLIQFCRDYGAKQVGVIWQKGEKPPSSFLNSGAVKQMKYVEKYLMPYKGRFRTSVDVYLAVFYPAAIDWPLDFNIYEHILNTKGSAMAEKFASQNPGITFKGDYIRKANNNSKLPTMLPSQVEQV